MTRPRTALPPEVKAFIVQAVARYEPPSVVAAAVKKEFGVVVTRQHVEGHDPTKSAGKTLGPKWRDLFRATREAFLGNIGNIGISHKAVRLRALDRMAERAEEQGNMALAAQMLEQAAKEAGDVYTNRVRQELTGKDGAPIQVQEIPADPIEAARAYQKLMGK